MRQIKEFTDERLRGFCAYCGGPAETRDHVPPRVFLDKPYPSNLPVVSACRECNEDISMDEWLHEILQISPEDQKKKLEKPQIEDVSFISDWDAGKISKLQQDMLKMSPTAFEKLAVEIFYRLGYPHVTHTGQPQDGGVDIIARRYEENETATAVIQCKRYQKNVGVRAARDLAGVLSQGEADYKGYLVTTSDFTNQCKKFVLKKF